MGADKKDNKIKDTFEALGVIAANLGAGTYGKGVDESFTTGEQGGNIFEQKIKEIKERTDDIEKSVNESEKRIRSTSQFVTVVAFAALVAFAVATVTVCLDYLNNTYGKYRNFNERVDSINSRLKILEMKLDKK